MCKSVCDANYCLALLLFCVNIPLLDCLEHIVNILFLIWCLHTNKRRPCSSTLSGHPSSSLVLDDQEGLECCHLFCSNPRADEKSFASFTSGFQRSPKIPAQRDRCAECKRFGLQTASLFKGRRKTTDTGCQKGYAERNWNVSNSRNSYESGRPTSFQNVFCLCSYSRSRRSLRSKWSKWSKWSRSQVGGRLSMDGKREASAMAAERRMSAASVRGVKKPRISRTSQGTPQASQAPQTRTSAVPVVAAPMPEEDECFQVPQIPQGRMRMRR